MEEFTVSEVIDGDTFKVKEGWELDEKKVDIVRPTGYNTPEEGEPGYEEAKQKLKKLILYKIVEINNPQDIDKGRLVADVYYEGKNLADYFPEYKT
jgi:micrococcal nuclease